MDRYNKANGTDVVPAAPPAADHPYYTSGDPQNDIPATTPGPWWFHMITESIRNVILAAGLTPAFDNLTLFLTAIKSLVAGGDYKASCRVASTVNVNTAAPGANIDGVAMAAGNRVLLKDQAAGAQNGIWIWNGAAVAMTRALDADDGDKLGSGAIIPIEQGTVNADTNWQLVTDGVITIGVTALTFVEFAKFPVATQAETDAGVISNKGITPLTLRNGFAVSLGANGYIKLPSWLGAMIIQWGTGVAVSSTSFTFPIAFTTACYSLAITCVNPTNNRSVTISSPSAVGFNASGWISSSGASTGETFLYIAIGK